VTLRPDGEPHQPGGVEVYDGTYTVTGNGDIAPSADGRSLESTLIGIWIGLIAIIVVAVQFATSEYRRGLMRTTLLASPRRGRALLAKATVMAVTTFVLGAATAAATITAGKAILRSNGNYILPVPALTEIRVAVGTGLLLALIAVLALAIGTVFRRGLTAVIAATMAVILPLVLSVSSVLPLPVSQWLFRITPAAGFAIQQSIPQYSHVFGYYSPSSGYYPLPPWIGLAVTAVFAAGALWLAIHRMRRSDA
ncbi:MAG: hypothetical protein ACRD0P_24610, partial [Stackebrandtia sp.]